MAPDNEPFTDDEDVGLNTDPERGPFRSDGNSDGNHRSDHHEAPEASTASSADLHMRSTSPSIAENGGIVPIWMRESSKSFHWKWVPLPVRHAARSVAKWSKGPDPPQIQKITPFFPAIQEAPVKLLDRVCPKRRHKAVALMVFLGAWLLTLCLMLGKSARSGALQGYGQPHSIWCGYSLWSEGNGCGLNGNQCRPFEGSHFPFRCSADCLQTMRLEPYAVGDQEIQWRGLVIGGGQPEHFSSLTSNITMDDTSSSSHVSSPVLPVYRADSFICHAAIHAGVISNDKGGCGVLALTGQQPSFPASKRNGVQSISFAASFPKSFAFLDLLSAECGVVDMHWPLLAVTVIFTTTLSLFTSSVAVFFPTLFVFLFFHVALVSDPPNIFSYPALFSVALERFLPAAFVAYPIYRFCAHPQLAGLTAHIEKTILYLSGAWLGALNNYTFDRIPIQRLTPHDLAQPGAKLALSLIVLAVAFIALTQAFVLQREGLFRRYITLYGLIGLTLLIGVAIPNLNLRIHHYILALLLLPGTRTQTRPALFYQGLLLGLFVDGVARWGFASILETGAALYSGGPTDTRLPSNVSVPLDVSRQRVLFGWEEPPEGYDGLSVLVDDVERFRWYEGEGTRRWELGRDQWRVGLPPSGGDGMDRGLEGDGKRYLRFAWMQGSQSADYTRAGVWNLGSGNWTVMKEGPS
ncbi:hypothetical protein MMC25_008000 [Agyrium rufum]|nr:hypothetical protein [Agyrium rufum]